MLRDSVVMETSNQGVAGCVGWEDAGNTKPPAFAGNDYYYMHDNPETGADEAHGFEPHYELHFWLYKKNPAGMFAQFNTEVTCANYKAAK